jgi:SAM-dependent methyltransferase
MLRLNRSTTSFTAILTIALASIASAQQTPQKPFEPTVGQAGKDVVWVPTSPALVEKMLDLAKVTPQDYVMDLGSGDGRNIIAAAKRGARATGVEYNADMVELSRRLAREAGVAEKATFIQGDMYEADISKASVLALFLLPHNLDKMKDRFLALPPGSRIVVNTFGLTGWEPDDIEELQGDCTSWCKAMLYVVPAKADGTWTMPQGELTLAQEFQMVTGSLGSQAITKGRLRGDEITFTAGDKTYKGHVKGDVIEGAGWKATRVR